MAGANNHAIIPLTFLNDWAKRLLEDTRYKPCLKRRGCGYDETLNACD